MEEYNSSNINRARKEYQSSSTVDFSSLYPTLIKSWANKNLLIDFDKNNKVTKITIKEVEQT